LNIALDGGSVQSKVIEMRPRWRRPVRLLMSAGVAMLVASAVAAPPSPAGEWMVAKGEAIIRVVDCGGQYWGFVAWEQNPGSLDARNPDPALRKRPTLGMPILLGMTPRAGAQAGWNGHIYNSEDGRTYDGRISLTAPDTLRVEGCVLGFLCGGENWRRVSGTNAMAASVKQKAAAVAKEPPARVCSEMLRRH
jgi:uncharacterized protein (DUF2147 family)